MLLEKPNNAPGDPQPIHVRTHVPLPSSPSSCVPVLFPVPSGEISKYRSACRTCRMYSYMASQNRDQSRPNLRNRRLPGHSCGINGNNHHHTLLQLRTEPRHPRTKAARITFPVDVSIVVTDNRGVAGRRHRCPIGMRCSERMRYQQGNSHSCRAVSKAMGSAICSVCCGRKNVNRV